MRILSRTAVGAGVATIILASMPACKAITRTTGLAGARDVSPQRFIEYYETPRRPEAYWEYIGAVGNHYYMEYYRTVDATYPEYVGEVRVPIRAMPEGFPAVRQGRPYPPYELPEQPDGVLPTE